MKRLGNLYDKIISLDNLHLADERARKGKLHSYGVKLHDRNKEANLLSLHEALKAGGSKGHLAGRSFGRTADLIAYYRNLPEGLFHRSPMIRIFASLKHSRRTLIAASKGVAYKRRQIS